MDTLPAHYTNADWLLDEANPNSPINMREEIYRGVAEQPGSADGYAMCKKMHPGNFVMYRGSNTNANGVAWDKNNLYEWDGAAWKKLVSPATGNLTNGWKYNDAVWDMTESGESASFMAAYIRILQAQDAFISNLFSKYITLKNGGYIQSEGITDGQRDFIIKSNGEAIFRKATIYGDIYANNGIFSGTLKATNIDINGTVTKGTAYLIRSDNIPVDSYTFSNKKDTLMKSIKTVAHGTATIRVKGMNSITAPDAGFYITLNDNTIITQETTAKEWLYEYDITLPTGMNIINLYYTYNNSSQNITITTFELRCQNDPKFLALLG
jgi:hypothetical protein